MKRDMVNRTDRPPEAPERVRLITARKMDRWFRNALGDDDRMPSARQCHVLARELQESVNRANNDQLRREAQRRGEPEPPLSELKDVPPNFRLNAILENVAKAATQLNRALDALEHYCANYVFADPDTGESISADDVRRVCFLLGGRWTKHRPEDSDAPPRGQPPKAWHTVAREFARAVERVLRELGHDKGLNPKNEASATAAICAEAVSWAYGATISSAAISSAVRRRNRKAKRCIPASGAASRSSINDAAGP